MNDRPSDAAGAGALAAGGIRERLRTFNPVLDRELRQRSRSMRSMWMIFTALAFLTLVLWLAYSGESSQPGFSSPLQSLATQVGQITFEWVLAVELTVLLFLIPGVSSGAIAGERDRQTLMPLQITLMRPTGIFVGMVLASSGFVLLLVAASVPVMTVPFLLGGVSLADVIASLLCLLAVGLLIAVISVGCSAIFRRATTATLAAYGTMLALTLGTALIAWFTALIDGARGFDEAKPLPATLYPNPFAALSDIGGKARDYDDGPLGALKDNFTQARPRGFAVEGLFFVDDFGGGAPEEAVSGWLGLPVWLWSLGSLAVIAALFAWAGIRRLRAPSAELSS